MLRSAALAALARTRCGARRGPHALTILAAAGLGLCTLVIALALGSAERELTLARLTTMGHDKPLRLLVTEVSACSRRPPPAWPARWSCRGWPRKALNLYVFTGRAISVPVRPSWLALGLQAAAVVVIAVAALAAETVSLRRRGVTGLLRAH